MAAKRSMAAPDRDGTTDSTTSSGRAGADEFTEPEADDEVAKPHLTKEAQRLMAAIAEVSASRLEEQIEDAAAVFAQLQDCAQVDAVLSLPPGTTQRFALDDAFILRAAKASLSTSALSASPNYGAVLTPKQRQAARLMAVGESPLSQVEAAKHVEVDRRTVSNWMNIPAFVAYKDQLEAKDAQERRVEAFAAKSEATREIKEIAMRKAKELVEAGDVRVILRVLDRDLK